MAQSDQITPAIEGIEPLVMQVKYNMPWERQSNQTACGNTIQYQGGDMNWRLVIEGKLTRTQLQQLNQLRGQDSVTVRTPEFGTFSVTFDKLNVTRADGEGVAEIDDQVQPIVNFQLQTKELDEDPAVTFVDE